MLLLIAGLLLFIGTHSIYIAAPAVREAGIARLGYNGWRGLYSLVSLVGLVCVVIGFGTARSEPVVLWSPPFWMSHLTMTLMVFCFPLLVASFTACHIQRAVKHPMLASVTIWAAAHLLANGKLADVLLFGSFLLWTMLARFTLLRRPMTPSADAPQGWLRDAAVVVAGLAIYALFLFGFHFYLIGVPLLG